MEFYRPKPVPAGDDKRAGFVGAGAPTLTATGQAVTPAAFPPELPKLPPSEVRVQPAAPTADGFSQWDRPKSPITSVLDLSPASAKQGVAALGQATASASTKNSPAAVTSLLAFQALAAGSGQVMQRKSGPTITNDPTRNTQSGHVVTGSVTVASAEEYMPQGVTADAIALTGGARRPNVGMMWLPKRPPSHGTVTLDPDGTFVYSPNAELARVGGTDTFTAVVIDRTGRANIVRMTVVVAANSAPTSATAVVGSADSATGAVSGSVKATDADGDPLTYGGSGPTPKGSVTVDPVTGEFTYTPTSEARHEAAAEDATADDLTDSFTATVTDTQGGITPVPVSVPVAPLNTPPVISVSVGSPDPMTGVATGSITGTDGDNDPLTYSVSDGPAVGSVQLDPSSGSFSYTPTSTARHEAAGGGPTSDTFTVTVSDGHGGTVNETVAVTIAPDNGDPTATFTALTPDSSGTVLGWVSGSDPDNDPLTYSVTGAPAGGTVSLNTVTGSFTYTPTAAARHSAAGGGATTDSFTVTVSDGFGGSVDQTVAVAILPLNNAPVPGVVTGAATEGGAPVTLTALAGATDPDGDNLSVTNVGALPAGVSYDAVAKSFTLDPTDAAYQSLAAGQTTPVTVSYDVSDGITTAAGSASWTVTGVNDAPVVSGAVTGSATEGGPAVTLSALANASDADAGTTLSVTGVPGTLPAGVSYDAAAKSFTLDPTDAAYQSLAAGQTTTVTVNYSVSDGTTSTPGSVQWTVTGINDAPVVTGTVSGTATEDGAPVTLTALANASDPDGGTLSVATVGTLPAGVTYDAGAGTFTLDPSNAAYHYLAAGETTDIVVSYSVTDGTATTPATATWTVTGINDSVGNASPVVTGPVSGTATEDTAPVTLNALQNASDPEGGTLSVVNVGALAAGVTYDAGAGTFTLDPSNAAYQSLGVGQTTTVTVTYKVSDGSGATATSVQWTVTGVNDAPTATATTGSPDATSGVVTGTVTGSDIDGGTLSYTTKTAPTSGSVTVNSSTGAFSYTPTAAARESAASGGVTTDTFTVTVSDGNGGTVDQVVTVSIAPPVAVDTSTSNTATFGGLGTYTDTSTNTTFTRTAVQTDASSTTANWEYMSVTYDPGSGPVTNTVFKSAGPDNVGVVTRVSNRYVTVGLNSSVAFTLVVKYNGRSTGTTYVFPAV